MDRHKICYASQKMSEIDDFKALLREATGQIEGEYIQLPVAGQENEIYRERIYTYELYHQLRSLWPASLNDFSLSGEVDKSGHPLIRDNMLDRVKPDILVHVPGEMDQNLVVLEVKPINGRRRGFSKDFKTLTEFRDRAEYDCAIHLTYGTEPEDRDHLLEQAYVLQEEAPEEVNFDQLEIWYHGAPGLEASAIHPNDDEA